MALGPIVALELRARRSSGPVRGLVALCGEVLRIASRAHATRAGEARVTRHACDAARLSAPMQLEAVGRAARIRLVRVEAGAIEAGGAAAERAADPALGDAGRTIGRNVFRTVGPRLVAFVAEGAGRAGDWAGDKDPRPFHQAGLSRSGQMDADSRRLGDRVARQPWPAEGGVLVDRIEPARLVFARERPAHEIAGIAVAVPLTHLNVAA